MKVEGNSGDGFEGMTYAEMEYLAAMEEVKSVSKQLVNAEQSFTLVKDRIQKLVARYEHILSKIEAQSAFDAGASSVVTYESSCFSEGQDSAFWEGRERAIWARRAKRAEVKAELAAREALLAKQEAQMIREEKQRELEALQQKLLELQSETSYAGSGAVDREHSVTLAKSIAMRRHDDTPSYDAAATPTTSLPAATPGSSAGNDQDKINDVKKRFRERFRDRRKTEQQQQQYASTTPEKGCYVAGQHQHYEMNTTSPSTPAGQAWPRTVTPSAAFSPAAAAASPNSARDIVRSAGEEVYQQLDFYERSLKAVKDTRL